MTQATIGNTAYADEAVLPPGVYAVTFLNNKTGAKLVRTFNSPYMAKEFARKLRYSKRCTLVSTSSF